MMPAPALRAAVADLNAIKVRWALIGGIAVSARAEPRTTKDVDFAIAVADDSEAESAVFRLHGRGYGLEADLEQNYVKRLSGVRLLHRSSGVMVDLLFASSGIENEISSQSFPA